MFVKTIDTFGRFTSFLRKKLEEYPSRTSCKAWEVIREVENHRRLLRTNSEMTGDFRYRRSADLMLELMSRGADCSFTEIIGSDEVDEIQRLLADAKANYCTESEMSQVTLGEALERSKAAEGEVRKLSAEINSLLREFQESIGDGKKIKALEDECQEKAQALDRILGDAQEKSSATAAFEHEKSFEEAIGNDTKQGRCWLAAFILLLMLTVAVVIYLYDKAGGFSAVDAVTTPQPQAGSWFPSLQITALRVLFVSILMTTTFWCGRMYKVMKNAALVNRHKNLCLKTFKHFVNATTSADVRDSVLKTAVSTIFITERTGLIAAAPSGEPETNNNVIQLGTSLLEKAASRGS